MEVAELVLRYLAVVLSWPVAAAPQAQIEAPKSEVPPLARAAEQQPALPGPGLPGIPQDIVKQVVEYTQKNPERVIEDYLRVLNGYRYERASQMALLRHLATKGTDGEAYVNLAPLLALGPVAKHRITVQSEHEP